MLEIEIRSANNEGLFFFPLRRKLRGRLDCAKLRGRSAADLRDKFPDAIPGVVVGFDGTSAYVRDPLHDDEHRAVRAKLVAAGYRLGPAREEFSNVDSATWAHWLNRAVEAGYAKVLSGKLPEVNGTPKLAAIVRQSREDVIDKLVSLVASLVPADKLKKAGLA